MLVCELGFVGVCSFVVVRVCGLFVWLWLVLCLFVVGCVLVLVDV